MVTVETSLSGYVSTLQNVVDDLLASQNNNDTNAATQYQLDSLQAQITAQQTAHQAEIDSMQLTIDSLNTALGQIQIDVTAQMAELETSLLSTLQTNVQTIINDLMANTYNIPDFNDQITEVQNALQIQINQISADDISNELLLSSLSGHVNTLQSSYDSLVDDIPEFNLQVANMQALAEQIGDLSEESFNE